MRAGRPVSLLLAAAMVCGCTAPEPEAVEPVPPEGRAETRNLRNAEAVGYSGNAIADKVDGALDASAKRQEQGDREAEEQTQ